MRRGFFHSPLRLAQFAEWTCAESAYGESDRPAGLSARLNSAIWLSMGSEKITREV